VDVKYTAKIATAACFLGAASFGTAWADSAQTLGGIVVRSDDGNFIGSLGGRIHFDYSGIIPDKSSPFDSGAVENDSGFYFRRVYITLTGKVYGWRYRIDDDISNTSNPANGFQEMFISHDIGKYSTVRIGQTKPWRSLDELSSNNEIETTGRNIMSATGLFGGRDYQQGVFYRYSHPGTFRGSDLLWSGISVYSLNKAGTSTDQGTGTPTQGIGYNARLAYAPIATERAWLHFGATYSSDHADNGAALTSGSSDWYSYKGLTQNLVSLKGTQPGCFTVTTTNPVACTSTTAEIVGGNNPDAVTVTGELAGAFGPGFLQAEFGQAKFRQPVPTKTGIPNEQTADAFAIVGSFYVTGETKRYDQSIASYATPKPLHEYGALELVAGYDSIRNRNIPPKDTSVCAPAAGAIPSGHDITKCELHYYTAGLTYYANTNVRFMLDYYYGTFDLGNSGSDRPKSINARMQLAF
jgi:phosphate-selective porin OprO/OprP